MAGIKRVKLYWNTIKYLRKSQIINRARFIFKRKFIYRYNLGTFLYHKKLKRFNSTTLDNLIPIISLNDVKQFVVPDPEGEELFRKFLSYQKKEFCFLNTTIEFDKHLGWNDESISHLWRYNLHYFNYIKDLGIAQLKYKEINNIYYTFKTLIEDWVEHNGKVGVGDGWHPYTISLRQINFIYGYSLFHSYLVKDDPFRKQLLNTLFLQMLFLQNNLEYDVYGNHLFENGKALIISGIFFNEISEGKLALKEGEEIIINELKEQVLSDGGHFERSPMYHSIILKDLSEIIYSYQNSNLEVPMIFIDMEKRMVDYLAKTIHPDGEISLFNDSAIGISDSPSYLFAFSSCKHFNNDEIKSFDKLLMGDYVSPISKEISSEGDFIANESGYLVSRDKDVFLIFDYGKPCPEYLPAHAHADIFSYELSFGTERMIVDTGTYEYTAGEMRDFNRSTRAHNTVTYKDDNQSEVWGSFRVANRAQVKVQNTKLTPELVCFSGNHDGYFSKYGVIHSRHLMHIKNKAIVIIDEICGNDPILKEDIKSIIHLAPNYSFDPLRRVCSSRAHEIKIIPINSLISKIPKGKALKSLQGWYSTEFGKKEAQEVLILSPDKDGNFGKLYFGYCILIKKNCDLKINHNDRNLIIELIDNGVSNQYNITFNEVNTAGRGS